MRDMEKFNVGDKVYDLSYGPKSTGTITKIDEVDGFKGKKQFITIKLDKPIETLDGDSIIFTKI